MTDFLKKLRKIWKKFDWKSAFFNVVIIFSNVTITIVTAVGIVVFFVYRSIEVPADLSPDEINQTSVIYDRTGRHILYEIYGEENRRVLPAEEIPEIIRLTTIAAEDSEFYRHPGIDPKAITRAMKEDIRNKDTAQGGSTITQQLVRNLYLAREKTWTRKVIEIVLALKMEKIYSKGEILNLYLNEIPYGSNAYGVASAAKIFFGKIPSDLTLDEAAFLAALPKAPTYYSPYGQNSNQLVARQQWILNRLEELDLFDKEKVAEAKNSPTLSRVAPLKVSIDSPHFVFYVKEQLEKKYGAEMLEKGGLRIFTTLDYDLQKAAEKHIAEGARRNDRYDARNAALVAIQPKTGEILAMVGSRDYFDQSIDGQVNVTVRPRAPGSSFKPFAYSQAFLEGYRPETLIADIPTDFGPDGSGSHYIPRNYTGKFMGVVTMRQALAMSLNIPAVKTLYLAGIDDTIDLATKMGITTLDNSARRYGLSLVLGGGEVTLLDETASYAVFANDGKRNPVESVLRIEDSAGDILYSASPQNQEILDPQVARMINSILSDNSARAGIFGPSSAMYIPGVTVAAKTGTSQEYRDGWTVGYTPNLSVGVWAGNNDSAPMKPNAGGYLVAAPVWKSFMQEALTLFPKEEFLSYEKPSSDFYKKWADGYSLARTKISSDKKKKKKDKSLSQFFFEWSSGAISQDPSFTAERWQRPFTNF